MIKIPKRKRIEHVVKKDATLMEYFNDVFFNKERCQRLKNQDSEPIIITNDLK